MPNPLFRLPPRLTPAHAKLTWPPDGWPELISRQQLAELMGLTTQSLRRYEALGILPKLVVFKHNNRRYRRAELIDSLKRILRGEAATYLQNLRELEEEKSDGR